MAKFFVVGHLGSTASETVSAPNAEAAARKATLSPSLCHQCSREMQVGEVYRVEVFQEDGDGDPLFDDAPEVDVDALRKENERLKKELAKAKRAARKPRKKVA